MNTKAITVLKATLKGPTSMGEIQRQLELGEWAINSHIRNLKDQGYIIKEGSILKLQKSPKAEQLLELAKKFDIENILRESNEVIISYLTEPTTISNLIVRTGLSKATVYRCIADLENTKGLGLKKQNDVISIDPDSPLFFFAKLLYHDRRMKETLPKDVEKEIDIESEIPAKKLSFEELKNHVWGAADVLRGSLDPSEYRQPIMTLLYLKRLNDTFEESQEKFRKQGKDEKYINDPDRYTPFIPSDAKWKTIVDTFENIGEKIDNVCEAIEHEDPNLEGVLTNTSYNDKKRFPDDVLLELVAHFNKKRLRNKDLENEDIFGQAYEYLLEQFADSAGKKAGEFFTPREVVKLLVDIVEPEEGMKICDPTCGSGGMLIWTNKYVKEHKGNPSNLILHGQERNYTNYGMCKMNMLLHNIPKFKIVNENVLKTPLLVENGKLLTYDIVIANFPFSMDWDSSNAANDPYGRFKFGITPSIGKADFAFIQHIYSILKSTGRAAIISSQGILFRGGEEANIRKGMIDEDVIEAIIALPSNLFFGTGIPGCILVLNKNKPARRKNKIIFIYAAKDYQEGKNRNKLRDSDIEKIVFAFKKFEDIDRYCHVVEREELEENEFNLNVPRYINISESEEEIDIQKTVDELKNLGKEREKIENKVKEDLKELGIKI